MKNKYNIILSKKTSPLNTQKKKKKPTRTGIYLAKSGAVVIEERLGVAERLEQRRAHQHLLLDVAVVVRAQRRQIRQHELGRLRL